MKRKDTFNKTLKLEKEISKGKFGKGDTSISQIKNYKLIDDEGDDLLDVKLQCSKKLDDAMTGFRDYRDLDQLYDFLEASEEGRGLRVLGNNFMSFWRKWAMPTS